MKILKFGGTSIGTADRMKSVVRIINDGLPKIVVLSALAGTTNSLLEIAELLYKKQNSDALIKINNLREDYENFTREILNEKKFLEAGSEIVNSHFTFLQSFTEDVFTMHEEKAVLAQGELLSTSLFHLLLTQSGIDSAILPALSFMRIDTNHEPDKYYIKENLLREIELNRDKTLYLTQGYICRNLYGEIDNLKRGGSDYTASLIGEALNSNEIQIWTDISGMHNNDPRFVKTTKAVPQLSFDEAAELAYFGAKVLHPLSVMPAKEANIPVRLKNTLKPEDEGTIISGSTAGHGIKAVASKDGITAVKIKSARMLLAYGFLRKIFEVFERYKTPIDLITTSEVAVSLTIDDTTYLKEIIDELKSFGAVDVDSDQSIICIVGENIVDQKGSVSGIFSALDRINIRMISYGGSRHNISLLVNTSDKHAALNSLNGIFDV